MNDLFVFDPHRAGSHLAEYLIHVAMSRIFTDTNHKVLGYCQADSVLGEGETTDFADIWGQEAV